MYFLALKTKSKIVFFGIFLWINVSSFSLKKIHAGDPRRYRSLSRYLLK